MVSASVTTSSQDSLGGPYPGPLRTRQAARFIRRDVQRDTPDAETANWRAVCEKTARTVRRAGRRKPSRPLSDLRGGSARHELLVEFRRLGEPDLAGFHMRDVGGACRQAQHIDQRLDLGAGRALRCRQRALVGDLLNGIEHGEADREELAEDDAIAETVG